MNQRIPLEEWLCHEKKQLHVSNSTITRLAPAQPRGLAAKYTEDEITKHIQARRLPVRSGQAAKQTIVDAHDSADLQDVENFDMGSDGARCDILSDSSLVGNTIVNN